LRLLRLQHRLIGARWHPGNPRAASKACPTIRLSRRTTVFPWAPEAYPGLLRGMAELLGRRAAVRTFGHSTGSRRSSKDRVNRDTQAIAELEKENPLGHPQRSIGDYKLSLPSLAGGPVRHLMLQTQSLGAHQPAPWGR
jgi:hypothetical protein